MSYGVMEMLAGNVVAVKIILEEVNLLGASPDEMKIRLTVMNDLPVGNNTSFPVKEVTEFEQISDLRKKFHKIEDILKDFAVTYLKTNSFNGDREGKMTFFALMVLGGSDFYNLQNYEDAPYMVIQEKSL